MQTENSIDPSLLQDKLTYDSWWEGRFTFIPGGLLINTNFDELKSPAERSKSAKLAIIPNTIPAEELKKITAKQEELFNTNLKYKTKNLTENFLERFKKSQDRPRLLSLEIEQFEKLLNGESDENNQFNAENRFFFMMGIDQIRSIYKERIVQGKRTFIDVRSHFCRFGMGRSVAEDFVQVEAYFGFLKWLKDYKLRYEELQQLIQETRSSDSSIKDELLLIEKLITDIPTHYTYYHIFQLENPADEHSKDKDEDGFEYEPRKIRFYEDIFMKEVERSKQAINKTILNLGYQSEKSSYINILHSKINGLVRKNHEKRLFFKDLKAHYAERVIHGFYHIQLRAFRDSIEKDYKPFIDPALLFNDTDEKKFMHSVLCSYHEQFEEISKHKNHECDTRKYQEKQTVALLEEFKSDYIEQYNYIMQKWVAKNKAGGHDVTEKNFIVAQIKMLDALFHFDNNALIVTAKDYQQKKYSFTQDFYKTYLVHIINFLRDSLTSKLEEIEAMNAPSEQNKKSLNKNKSERVIDESFTYDSGESTTINLTQLHDKLIGATPPFIKKPKDIRTFRKIFSGEKIVKPVIWLGTNYELHTFIKFLTTKIEECNHFAVAVKCFHDKENGKINYDSLRTARRKPTKEREELLKSMIESI